MRIASESSWKMISHATLCDIMRTDVVDKIMRCGEVGNAGDFDSSIRWFKSSHRSYALIAQLDGAAAYEAEG